ncbi:MAG: hypothetical protein EPO08_00500 [Rhodospirillaceae bacterium]|nr:MAG: hypothetical protein EPO08_00500 [Rhodospirillaceae bacterium]
MATYTTRAAEGDVRLKAEDHGQLGSNRSIDRLRDHFKSAINVAQESAGSTMPAARIGRDAGFECS